MYGPIIPVMKNIGTNEMMTARVARMIGGRTSFTALITASKRRSLRMAKWRWMFSTSTIGIVHDQPQRQDQGEQRHAVDRVAEQQVDEQREAEGDRARPGR